jgi:uncharacterized protein involved in outer membrane biogenesis
MTKTVKRLVWVAVVLVVLLVALVALLPTLVSSSAVRSKLVALAEDHLTGKLEIGDLQVSWFGGLRMRDLRLGNPPGYAEGAFVACSEATGGIALWPLLHGVIDLQTIRLQKPELRLERAKSGVWNWEAIVKGGLAPAGQEPRELPKMKAKLEARDAHMEIRDDALGTRTEASGVTADVSADLTGAEPRYEFSGTVPSVAANQSMGPLLAFVVPFAGAGDSGTELTGTMSADARGSVEGRDAKRLAATLKTDGKFSLKNGKVAGSPLASKLLALLGEPAAFEIDSMEAPFTIRDGFVETPDVTLDGKRAHIRFSGKTGLDGRLDLHAVVKPKEGARPAGSALERLASGAELKFGIGGTVASPNITPETPTIDPKDALEKGAGEALKLLEKKKKN